MSRDASVVGFPVCGIISSIHFEPIRPSGNCISSRMIKGPPQPRIGIQDAIRKRPPVISVIEGTFEPS